MEYLCEHRVSSRFLHQLKPTHFSSIIGTYRFAHNQEMPFLIVEFHSKRNRFKLTCMLNIKFH